MFNVAHGAGLAAIWDSWANHVYMENPTRFAKLGHRVFGLDDSDTLSCALNTIEKMEEFFRSIGMPTSIRAQLENLKSWMKWICLKYIVWQMKRKSLKTSLF